MQFIRPFLLCAALVALVGCQPESKQAESRPAEAVPTVAVPVVEPEPPAGKNGIEPTVKSVTSTAPSEFEITYEWKLAKKLDHDWRVFVHFTDFEGQIKFQNDHDAEPATTQWKPGKVQQGPFKVNVPEEFEGEVQIRMGLYDNNRTAAGASARLALDGNDDGELRILVGRLLISDAALELLPID